MRQSQDMEKNKEVDETPESPDSARSSSPDCQILPIVIPTERSMENRNRRRNQRQKEIPVITLTDSTKTITISSPTDSNSDDVTYTEWDMLEESARHSSKNRGSRQPSLVATSHDVATAAKLISNSLPQKVSDNRNYNMLDPQDIPTVPVPSLGGSRRLSSFLEKNRLNLDKVIASSSRSESPVNVPEVRLNSPDPEILFAKPRSTSPRSKDSHNTLRPSTSKPPSIPLLVSPPPLSHEPLLSMEDLAELLNDEGDGGEKTNENAAKQNQDKVSKNFSLSEKEKLTTRKSLPNTAGVSPVKSSELKGPPHQSNDSHRLAQASFLGSRFQQPRYADNYERHPRQRDAHAQESAKDKVITISDEIPSQVPVFNNAANKPDERNVPLYQRRPTVPDLRKNVNLPRPENEFVIDNSDYYSMHANQMHWASPTATNDHQFNTQWTSPTYGGITNPPLQSTQHSFSHPLMEPQFRPSQFPTTLPVGPRPLINPTVRPQEMSHVIRPENVREDIPAGFPSQYRGFQMGQGSYEPSFSVGRSTEYPHVRPTWEGTANRMGETTYENVIPCGIPVENPTGTSFPRPNTPCPWGTRDRGNRSQGRDGYYDRNRPEIRPSFNRDGRRSDWSRDGHSDRENPNRFPNRDPRVRTEHNVGASQAKETGTFVRDPRLAKDKHVSVSTKVKDTVPNERDPRKRVVTANTKTTKEKPKSQKSPEKEKLPKDRMQSPLESLYGVIDTKVSQNSGLQKFKIPKIKRPEAPQSNRVVNEAKKIESTSLKPSRVKSSGKSSNKNNSKSSNKKNNKLYSKNKSKDVASAEVSSSSDGNRVTENLTQQSNVAKEGKILSSSLEKSDKNEINISEADSVTNNSKSSDIAKKDKKDELEADESKSKEGVTQEFIEALIRKSFESGEGKKLVEQAKLIQKFGEVLKTKKLEKIKKIIESESESSSDKDETVEAKKNQTKKKRRVIVSDSSDDECLAERLSILTTDTTVERELATQDSTISTDPKNSEIKLEAIASSNNLSKKLTKDITAKKSDSLLETCVQERIQVDNKSKDMQLEKKNDRLEDNENTDVQSESEKQISGLKDSFKQIDDNQDKIDEKTKDSTKSNIECLDQNTESVEILDRDEDRTTQSVASDTAGQEVSNDKPKAKTKRRNSLEMLQEDIREMFISEGVVTATGHRLCRLSKENQSPSRISPSTLSMNSKKNESNTAEKKIAESNTETNESVTNNVKSRKSLRSRNVEESSKPKGVRSKNEAKRTTRSLRLKKSTLSSDSEEDQPLALRTEKLLNNTGNSALNQEVDCREEEETNDILRRSKRVLRKDIVKEPRVVVEKADITKIDSSKVMFDSSSDESFNIDVSKLAAVVDISLQKASENHSDQDSVDTVISSRRRKDLRKQKSKKPLTDYLLTDDKSTDEMSFTDEESATSDISMSSNTTVKRGTSSGAARTTTREELLSNILIGLVPMTEKTTSIDKGSEADFEEDANDSLAVETGPKRLVKKKKKKSSWKMGIVSTKKKKKKTASAASPKTVQTSVEETPAETNVPTDPVEANRSISGDEKPATAEKSPKKILKVENLTDDDVNINSVKHEIKPFVQINTDSFDLKDFASDILSELTPVLKEGFVNDPFLSIEESKLPIKMDFEEAKSSSNADLTAASDATATKFFKESPKIIYDELMTELFRKIDIKYLIDYAWVGQEKYKCLLCFFTGKNIVHHYKVNHSGREVLISRFKSMDAQAAIMDAERNAITSTSVTETDQMYKFRCRFCCFVTEGAADVALEAFYEHCTTHTGEYRFHCNNCFYQAVAKASIKTHYYKICRRDKSFNESASEDIVPREGGIYGYLCCHCNYVQLKRENVEAHVAFWHREQTGVKILKINMSVTVEQPTSNNEQSGKLASVDTEESFVVETKPQVPELEECKDVLLMDTVRPKESEGNDGNTNECTPHEPKTQENIQIKEEENEERPRLSRGEPEGSVSTGNLSVFVCSAELENKEMEIQRERQKTMQEIANDIGILSKNSKPGLSIIDKLQDKMRTDLISPIPECNASVDTPEVREDPLPSLVSSSTEELKTEDIIIKEDLLSQPSSQEDLSFTKKQLAADKSEVTNDENDKVDVKIRDPLSIMDPCKDNESDGENSDNERSAPIFESDSSSEQSDSEQTDVNTLLKETSNINASSSRDPMLTTIQRLAAQLQNVKPLEPMPEPMLHIKTEIKTEPVSLIPKPPDVVPIASVKHLLKQQSVKCTKKEMLTPTSCKNASPPKNFIRFRRLSGDMLSATMPALFPNNQEDLQESNTGR